MNGFIKTPQRKRANSNRNASIGRSYNALLELLIVKFHENYPNWPGEFIKYQIYKLLKYCRSKSIVEQNAITLNWKYVRK